MEFFNTAKAVRLKSHLDKFLVADEDQRSVRQGRNGSSNKVYWTVELVEGSYHLIRLKNSHGGYLSASDEPFLLGMTGKRVLQALPNPGVKRCHSMEWEPIKEGYKVKLRTRGGTYLRANGATPPWRNTITHDLPYRTATQDWVLWDVDLVDLSVLQHLQSYPSSSYNCSSLPYDQSLNSNISLSHHHHELASESLGLSRVAHRPSYASERQSGMEFFYKAKAVRLESHLGKYLVGDDDEESVRQSRSGASLNARWTVEFVEGKDNVIRLKSCHGLYLTAAEEPFLLGMTGKKVVQTLPTNKTHAPSIEWEPIKEGFRVKLRTAEGKYLRANGATPPWRNSVTHDLPNRTATQDWVLWGVDVVDIVVSSDASDSPASCLSPPSSFNSVLDDTGTPPTRRPHIKTWVIQPK
ncbi:uncharacterized protein LOC115998630 [Ipomoea triloba]|uniref:uncharacterized protein LOC115998630 n=1 Tax=Ipomoea triloba TaxID=35885 RepID=UPI00125D8A04|nr:uncharacterized protein LOC115998630 [Ipomoea triloba]